MRVKPKQGGPAHTPRDEEPKPVAYPWEAAQAALASGAYDIHGNPKPEDRGPDQPGAQSPAPGVDPVIGGRERAAPGDVLTNIGRVSTDDQAELVQERADPDPSAPDPKQAPKSQPAPKPEQK